MLIWSWEAKNADRDKYGYSDYDIGFDPCSQLSGSDGRWSKNIIIFSTDMSSSVYVDFKNKNNLVLGEGLTQGLYDITITAEEEYPFSFTQSGKRFVWILHYNGGNSFLFVNEEKIIKLKQKIQIETISILSR